MANGHAAIVHAYTCINHATYMHGYFEPKTHIAATISSSGPMFADDGRDRYTDDEDGVPEPLHSPLAPDKSFQQVRNLRMPFIQRQFQ